VGPELKTRIEHGRYGSNRREARLQINREDGMILSLASMHKFFC
jgi:hypothetical protein